VCIILKRVRVNGIVPWNRIVDRSKPVYEWRDDSDGEPDDYFESNKEDYESAEETFKDAAESYTIPYWSFQSEYVEVWCEKDAMSGVLRPITAKWFIPLVVCRGYQSIGNIHDRLEVYKRVDERKVTILYFGDYDPHGEYIPEVIQRDFKSLGFTVNLNKIALTSQQIEQYHLIPAPCKKTDSMANHWISQHGDMVYELDALEPATLLQIVEESIMAHFSREKFKERNEYIEKARQKIARQTSEYFGEDEG
jgi:hypothetical protein